MKKFSIILKIVGVFALVFVLSLCVFSILNRDTQITKDQCTQDVIYLVETSYETYGDYSQLDPSQTDDISKENFEKMCYRTTDDKVGAKWGKEYFEVNDITPKSSQLDGDKAYVEYEYNYDCRSYATNESIYSLKNIPVTVTLEKVNGLYKVVDVEEKI